MRSLSQIKDSPRVGDKFERNGQVFEVVGLADGGVVYRVEKVSHQRPNWVTLASWRALASDTFSNEWED